MGDGRCHVSGEESQPVGGRSSRGAGERLLGGGCGQLGGGGEHLGSRRRCLVSRSRFCGWWISFRGEPSWRWVGPFLTWGKVISGVEMRGDILEIGPILAVESILGMSVVIYIKSGRIISQIGVGGVVSAIVLF